MMRDNIMKKESKDSSALYWFKLSLRLHWKRRGRIGDDLVYLCLARYGWSERGVSEGFYIKALDLEGVNFQYRLMSASAITESSVFRVSSNLKLLQTCSGLVRDGKVALSLSLSWTHLACFRGHSLQFFSSL